jgi:hypothetical protein
MASAFSLSTGDHGFGHPGSRNFWISMR